MKTTIILLVTFAVVLCIQAQDAVKTKGDECKNDDECKAHNCVEGYCGCKYGHLPAEQSHGSDQSSVYVCEKVVGHGCNHNTDCSEHLKNSKCDRVCVCNKDEGCTDGGMTLTVMSLTAMMGISVGLLKIW